MSPERDTEHTDSERKETNVATASPVDALVVQPAGASADDLEVYPHDRFLAALDGRMPMHQYALDALNHVEIHLARRRRA